MCHTLETQAGDICSEGVAAVASVENRHMARGVACQAGEGCEILGCGEVAHVVDELQVILLGALDVDVGAVHLAGGHEQAGIVVAFVKVVGVVDVA